MLIVLACLGIAMNMFVMFNSDNRIYIDNQPHHSLSYPIALHIMEQLLNMAGSGLVIFQCKLAIDAAKAKSR